jgi:hypothetical protein
MVNAQNQLSNFTRIYQSLGQKIESTQMVKGDHSKI